MFEWRKSVHYWWSYILFSPECKELTSMLDPLLYRWGVPPVVIRCVHWTMQMWVLQAWVKAQGIAIVMLSGLLSTEIFISTGEWGAQMPPLTAENSHFLQSGSQEVALVKSFSYHSCVSVYNIQQKGLLNKISVYAFTHPDSHHCVAKATLFIACTHDGCGSLQSPVTSSEVTWSWHATHVLNSEIFISQNNAFFIVTTHAVKNAVDTTDWGTGITMGVLFAFLRMSTFVKVCVGCQANQWHQPASEK